jgi:6-carboxyhexanoate--CoA ligase
MVIDRPHHLSHRAYDASLDFRFKPPALAGGFFIGASPPPRMSTWQVLIVDNRPLSLLIFIPMKKPLYSIRMRSSRSERHISGAERLAQPEGLDALAAEMVRRALQHDKGQADKIVLTLEQIDPSEIVHLSLPDIRTVQATSVDQGRAAALSLLAAAGVNPDAALNAMDIMSHGAAPDGDSMRGAMLIDANSGRRLENDRYRGVRVSRMDLDSSAEILLKNVLEPAGLDNTHVRDALVLATKVMHAPGVMAELCWSDDPGYTAGYVAASSLGYVRFPMLKPLGEIRGGRSFFVTPGADLPRLVRYLERQTVLVDRVGRLLPDERWPQ